MICFLILILLGITVKGFPCFRRDFGLLNIAEIFMNCGELLKVVLNAFLHRDMVTSYCCKGIECSSSNENRPHWLIYLNASSIRRNNIVFNLD